jgi:hypothetical protein
MNGIRVIRTLEYHYSGIEEYLRDSQQWTMQSPNTWNNGNTQMRTVGVTVSIDNGPWSEHSAAIDITPDIMKALRQVAADEFDRQELLAQIKRGLQHD